MAPLPAPAEKPSHRVSDSQSHAKVRPPTQVAVFCAALWPNLQPALTVRTRIWHSDWKPRWLIRCVSAALLSFMDKQVHFCAAAPVHIPAAVDKGDMILNLPDLKFYEIRYGYFAELEWLGLPKEPPWSGGLPPPLVPER